ncbi:LysR substrate-binding domain-containing protein [Alicycliphilus denitrificans]|uniref:LysR substrate-binding domain-containing protein n=1 Tax=Alicycliphilus denitrificans TaxID=179636 RepID=UPI00384F038F
MRYELSDLRLFLEIAQARSLTAAAAAVFITPSAASYRLKNLEQALGTALFERSSRGMDLTPAGEAMLLHVRELFEGIARMQGDVSRFISGVKGHVRLVANSSSLNGFVTPTLGRFLVAYPGIDAEIEERQSETIPAAVLAREADVGIFAGPSAVQGLVTHPYAVDRLVIVTPRDHLLAVQSSLRLGAALDFDFVCMARSSSNYLFLRDSAQRLGKTVRARLHAHSFDAVLSLVAAGVGIALVPSSVLGGRLQPEQLAVIALDEPWALRELSLVVRKDARFPDFITEFVNFLLEDPQVAMTRAPG